VSDDRGLWFDGKVDFMTLRGYIQHHTSTLMSWVKPQGFGVLYSSSSRDLDGQFRSFGVQFGIKQRVLTFSDMSVNGEFSGDVEISFYKWQHVAVTTTYRVAEDETAIQFYSDGSAAGAGAFDGIIVDWPDQSRRHLIGSAWSEDHCS
jgi:hypothetical protein